MADQFYYCEGKKIPLKKSTTQTALKLENAPGPSIRRGVSFMASRLSPNNTGVNLGDNIYLFDINDRPRIAGFMAASAGNAESSGVNVRDVFEFGNNEKFILMDEFIVKFKDEVSAGKIKNFITGNDFENLRQLKIGKSVYVLKLKNYENALDQINSLVSNPIVEYAEPKFKRIQQLQIVPDDTEFIDQWAFNSDEDINIQEAWDITKGKKSIVIAIIDDGVDYDHEDLKVNGKLKTGFNAVNNSTTPDPVNNEDYHGTFCAGLAAAAQNSKGISGVAPDCSLMGIKIADTVNDEWVTDNEILAAGIQKAVDSGVDVLSCSWGGGGQSQSVNLAIRNAKNNGRSGKGCVVCFAAGNYKRDHRDTYVLYPGTMKEVITVAACNQFGEWKSFTSLDGVDWWGSRYGTNNEVDVCAPGVKMITTDISGARGSNGEGNYVYNFGGTSAATPIVAGVAALVLSVNSNLTAAEVEDILRLSTDRLYSGNYDQKTGFGRINALKAVTMAKETL